MRALVLPALAAILTCEAIAQAGETSATTSFLEDFAAALGAKSKDPSAFKRLAQERIWATYEWPAERKQEVFAYLRNAADGPAKGFAALIAVGFRDPAGVDALLDAATDPGCSTATRYWCLNAAPCLLGMGDVWCREQTADERAAYVEELRKIAKAAKTTSIGQAHAALVQEILADAAKAKAENKSGGDFGLALWHVSAYQLGSLDLASYEQLRPLLNDLGAASLNVMHALALAANQDFFAPVITLKPGPEQDEAAKKALVTAREWWLAHKAEARPLRERLAESFAARGIDPEAPESPESLHALKEILASENRVAKYNAYRLFNELAGTHFDLEFVFLLDKYALHPVVSGLDADAQEKELRQRVSARIDRMVAAARK